MSNYIDDFIELVSKVGYDIYEHKYGRVDENKCLDMISEISENVFVFRFQMETSNLDSGFLKNRETMEMIFDEVVYKIIQVSVFFHMKDFDEALCEMDAIPRILEPIWNI